MAEIDQANRTIRVKIVYYGPPLGGKTTNLLRLHALAVDTHRGEMISINSLQDRTILFDLLPFAIAGPRGFNLRLQLLAVPGQALYSATRRAALRGVDGVVFVANSATDRWQDTRDVAARAVNASLALLAGRQRRRQDHGFPEGRYH